MNGIAWIFEMEKIVWAAEAERASSHKSLSPGLASGQR